MHLAKSFVAAAVATMGLVLAPTLRSQEISAADYFVGVQGTHFERRGTRVNLFGANVAVMHGPQHRAALEATLDAVRADGLSTVRLWAFGEQPRDAPAWAREYAFRIGEGQDGWVEESFVHLDRALILARARGLGVIVVLTNRWSDYGGVAQHMEWSGLPLFRQEDRSLSPLSLPLFFGDGVGPTTYDQHVERVVTRINSLNQIPYRDDPTIVAWELINESDIPTPRHRSTLVDWTRASARHIRALDANHMISAGHIGYMDASQRRTWMAVNALPEISYADAHAYPTQYGDVHTFASLDRYIDDHIQLAHHVLHKPFIWGEFAFNTQTQRHAGRPSLAWFDRFLARTLFDDADGALVWIYATAQARLRPHAIDIDGDEHEGAFVRARMQQLARDADHRRDVNTSLNDSLGDASLWLAPTVFRGPLAARTIAAHRFASRWQFGPNRIYEIQGQGAGFWQAFPSPHIYVSGAGAMTFRLSSPLSMHVPAGSIVRLNFRASSELPGQGLGAMPDDASRIRVEIDGLLLGEVDVIPDDGIGAEVMVQSTSEALLERLRRPGRHTLRFVVLGDERANGLCLYGPLRAPSITLTIVPPVAR